MKTIALLTILFALAGCATAPTTEGQRNEILERHSERGEAVDVSKLPQEEREVLAR